MSSRIAVLAAVPALAALTSDSTGPTAPLLDAVSVAAWLCTTWLLLVAVLEHGSRLPGTLGRVAGASVRRLAPRSVRALVGASVAVAVLAAPAHAEERAPVVAGSASDVLDWPGLAPETAAPSPTAAEPSPSPTAAAAPAPTPTAPAAPAPTPTPTAVARPAHVVPHAVVVREGDSLWAIAARALGPTADDKAVSQAWPRWWAANRSVVGDHPDLIHPGDRLSAP